MDTTRLFTREIKELEELPEKPDIFWYPSAGKDFRGNVFLTDYHMNFERVHHGKTYSKPDLFVFNCLGIARNPESEEIKQKINRGEPLYEDSLTRITGHNLKEFGIRQDVVRLEVNPRYVEKRIVNIPEPGKEAFYFEIEITGKEHHYKETQKILYLEHENIDVFRKIMLRSYFNVLYLCASREGCGFGGCKKSVIDYVYRNAYPHFYIDQGFMPEFTIVFHDFVRDVFNNAVANSETLKAHKSRTYIKGDSSIHRLSYNL